VTSPFERALGAVRSWPVDHTAAGVRTRDGVTASEGPADREFELASVTKVLTAVAVLVAAEEEVLDLDEPAGPPGSTFRHLLAHASGLGPEQDDPVTDPGRRRVYSNAGYELLGELVGERSAMPIGRYLHEAVCAPLAMSSTTLHGSPAHGARSTLADLLGLAGELLAPGRVIAPETLAEATEPFLGDLRGVLPGYGTQDPNPWGLGVELRGEKDPHWTPHAASPRTFGHFGQAGTMLWVDPDAGLALVVLSDRDFGEWAIEALPRLGADVLAAVGEP
jgi:CubicO group peptidase (beta-lactamase class C family)